MRTTVSTPMRIAVIGLLWLAGGCGQGTLGSAPGCEQLCDVNAICAAEGAQAPCFCADGYAGDGYTCVDIDECAAGNPCGGGVCGNVEGGYVCDCDAGQVFDGVTCVSGSIAIVGGGSAGSPRTWADGALAASCLGYLEPEPPYVYEGSTGDGVYVIAIDGNELAVYCDMTTDGGGWTALVYWDRASLPEEHTLESLQDQFIDELSEFNDPDISPMGVLAEDADPLDPAEYHVAWWDNDFSYDALAYRRDVKVENRGELLFDVHYEGYKMEKSSIWFYVAADDGAHDLLCWSDAENSVDYSPSELALVPYACGADISVVDIFWDTAEAPEQRALGTKITSFHLRSLHHDAWQVDASGVGKPGDSSRLYRLGFYVR